MLPEGGTRTPHTPRRFLNRTGAGYRNQESNLLECPEHVRQVFEVLYDVTGSILSGKQKNATFRKEAK